MSTDYVSGKGASETCRSLTYTVHTDPVERRLLYVAGIVTCTVLVPRGRRELNASSKRVWPDILVPSTFPKLTSTSTPHYYLLLYLNRVRVNSSLAQNLVLRLCGWGGCNSNCITFPSFT